MPELHKSRRKSLAQKYARGARGGGLLVLSELPGGSAGGRGSDLLSQMHQVLHLPPLRDPLTDFYGLFLLRSCLLLLHILQVGVSRLRMARGRSFSSCSEQSQEGEKRRLLAGVQQAHQYVASKSADSLRPQEGWGGGRGESSGAAGKCTCCSCKEGNDRSEACGKQTYRQRYREPDASPLPACLQVSPPLCCLQTHPSQVRLEQFFC
mmetsp:Transcript_23274/g.75680  ORF Transcript_23274/g.75680 Transcript_23274/m.75680 type:complete len:208 (-) Transcript_23274:516-1139(-)